MAGRAAASSCISGIFRRARRLPLRAYVAGFTLKNGVPINYIEAIGLCEWIEVGFNTFYTYRQGETAWIYAQALRCLRAFTGATTISVYPYQIGQNNDEAIDSGAFWFYRKLGFRSGRPDLEQLARREEQKIAANPQYRTPKKTLKTPRRSARVLRVGSDGAWEVFGCRWRVQRAADRERHDENRTQFAANREGHDFQSCRKTGVPDLGFSP